MSHTDPAALDEGGASPTEPPEGLLEDISELVLGEAGFRELEQALDVFCPFEAMGMVRQEIRHSNFLAYLLDPRRPHGFGSRMFKRLLRKALAADPAAELTALDIHLRDFSQTELRREWGNIDVLAISPMSERGVVTAIELKIEAREHGDQLSRMRRQVESQWPEWTHFFIFLTPDGREPSKAHGAGWRTLEIGAAIEAFEEELADNESGHPDARRMLQSYIAMLRRNYVSNSKHEEIAAELWRRHPKALNYIADRRPDIRSKVMDALASDPEFLRKISDAAGHSILIDSRTSNTIRLAVEDWDKIDGFRSSQWTESKRLILLQIESFFIRGDLIKFFAKIEIGPGDPEQRERLFREVKGAVPNAGSNVLSPLWSRLDGGQIMTVPQSGAVEKIVPQLEAAILDYLRKPKIVSILQAISSMPPKAAP